MSASWIVLAACVALGAPATLFGVRQLVTAMASSGWPTAQGRVLSSKVHESRRGGSSGTVYSASVKYEFTGDGKIVHGTRIGYGDFSSGIRSFAQDGVDRYPEGRKVTVSYKPGSPGECLLEPGIRPRSWGLAAFGLFFLTFGVYGWSSMRSKARKRMAAKAEHREMLRTQRAERRRRKRAAGAGEDD